MKSETMKSETKTIAIGKIVEAKWNTRSEITESSVNALAESIKADGLLQPLNVIADGDKFVCFDGCRRLNALRSIKAKDAPCRVWGITEAEAKVKTVTANLQREDDDPLLAAKVIGELLDAGENPEQIASKLGKTTPWVRRRAKLCALASDVAEKIVGKVTLDALEKIAVMPPKAQSNLVNAVKRRVGYANGNLITASDLRYDIQREQADLDEAQFCTGDCRACDKRTGAQPDLWGETDGKLGHCNDYACFREKVNAFEDDLIAKATKGAKSVERCEGSWNVPKEADADRPTKKKSCAYVYVVDCKAFVKFGPTREEIDAAHKEEQEARKAEEEAKSAERDRERRIKNAFRDAMLSEDRVASIRDSIRDLVAGENATEDQLEWIADVVACNIEELWTTEDIARVLRVFHFTRELCGISDEDAKWYIDLHEPEAEESETDNEN